MTFKNLFYSITCLAFAIIIGAAVYEHLAVVPQWSAAPPKSLTMFQGTYGLRADSFWKMIHPLTVLLFITTWIMHRKSVRRYNINVAFTGYLLILGITAFYFVPELIEITTTPQSENIDLDLTSRATKWESLSLVRLACLLVLSVVLFFGLTRKDPAPEEMKA